jgi:hypothetical protein
MPKESQAQPDLVRDGILAPNLDMPSGAFTPLPSADVLTDEDDPPVRITDKGFGPYEGGEELTDEEMEAREKEAEGKPDEEPEKEGEPDENPADAAEPLPRDTPEEGDGAKEGPKYVPYDRFQEIAAENQRLKQADAVLKWIMANPEQAAARLGVRGQSPPSEDKRFAVDLAEPKSQKPFEELDETEKARLWVERSSYNYLKSPLEKVAGAVNELLQFKEQLTETLTKNAVDKDGKPMHPRWDELRGTMREVKTRYQGMTDAEAYVLADRMIPQSTPMGDEMAAYNAPLRSAPVPQKTPAQPPAPKPKRASPAALRAAKVASFGRSSPGMSSVEPERLSAEKSAEKAFDEILKSMP